MADDDIQGTGGQVGRTGGLEDELPASPHPLVDAWVAEAEKDGRIQYFNAACLATVDTQGWPDSRIILLKDVGTEGYVFYTNLESPKGKALLANPQASLTLYWEPLGRQIRARGPVEPVSAEEADAYFATRPRGSQIGAWASSQSEPAADRGTLEERFQEAERRFDGTEVPRPPHWGGFRLHPHEVELWLEREYRLHDRFLYRRLPEGTWSVQRLFP